MAFSELLRGYLRSRARMGILFAAQMAVLFLVSGLYGLPLGPTGYTAVLSAALWLGAIVLDLRRYQKQMRALEALYKQALLHLDQLPPTKDLQRALHWKILDRLEKRRAQEARQAGADAKAAAQYYTVWSHQAKTPLTAMRLLLREEELDRATLQQELYKAEQYVDMALQYQRLQAGPGDLVLRELELGPLVRQAVRETSALFIGKKIAVELGELPGSVLSDQKWLLFVLGQVLTNAVKYTLAGSVRVWYENGVLSIRDTGIDIRADDLPRVFEWGYTGGNGRHDTRATGIGLSLCKRTMAMLGHTICLESTEGVGTTVHLGLSRDRFDVE